MSHAKSPTRPVQERSVPAQIGPYRIEAELSRGGVGVVYRAVHEGTGKAVALKQLLAQSARREHVRRLFEREYHTLAQLAHPRIIEVYSYGVEGDLPYYSMELLDGVDLRELAPLPWRAACSDLRDIASSLALVHARRLVHRDVSPRNVRRTTSGRAKLIDFGAIAGFGASVEIVGTPPCIAPEVLRGLPLDARSDMYALGVLAYFALTGRFPYPASRLEDLEQLWTIVPEPPSASSEDVPPALDELVMALLRSDPMARPSTAAEVIDRLTAIAELPPEDDERLPQSFLASPPLIARETMIARFGERLDELVRGAGRSIIVRGLPGSGRTRLSQVFSVDAQLRGAMVLRADAHDGAGAYAVPRQLLQAMLRAAPEAAAQALMPHLSVLLAEFPFLGERFRASQPTLLPTDPGERRARLQEALLEVFVATSASTALVVVVDNLERADDQSAAFLAALSQEAPLRKILLISTLRRGGRPIAPDAIRTLRRASEAMNLEPWRLEEVDRFVRELFADPANSTRLSHWLAELTGGNPGECLELLNDLVKRRLIRYEDGAWVLPHEFDQTSFPASLEQARSDKLASLSPDARALAESLSVWNSAIRLEDCMAHAAEHDGRTAFALLSELVTADVLLESGGEYRIAHEALREHLAAGLDETRRRRAHRIAAELVSASGEGLAIELEAGFHWLEAGEETRGAEMLARAGAALARRGVVMHKAVPGLEAALRVYDAQGRSPYECVDLLIGLAFCCLYSDHRLIDRYGDRILRTALELGGLGLARRLQRLFGRKGGLYLGIAWAAIQHLFRRTDQKFEALFVDLLLTLALLSGASAVRLQPHPLARLHEAVEPLLGFGPNHPALGVVGVIERTHATIWNLQDRSMEIAARDLARLEAKDGFSGLEDDVRVQLRAGSLVTLALTSAQKGDPATYHYADKLEEAGLSFYHLMALYSRFLYHAYRGETVRLKELREKVDYFAVRGGTTWQAEFFVPVNLLDSALATDDVVTLREICVRLEKSAWEVDVFRAIASFARAAYFCARGRLGASLHLYESVLDDLLVMQPPEFLLASAGYARALNRAGQHERAEEVCSTALERMPVHTRTWGLWASELTIQHALAEAALGRPEEAANRIEAALGEFESTEHPLRLATLHMARAAIALLAWERDVFFTHIGAASRWIRPTGNPALAAQLQHLHDRGRQFESSVRPSTLSFVYPSEPAPSSDLGSIEGMLTTCATASERVEKLLDIAIEKTGAARGYVYALRDGEVRLLSRSEPRPPLPELEQEARALVERWLGRDDLRTEMTVTSTARSDSAGISTAAPTHRVYLLTVKDKGTARVLGALGMEKGEGELRSPSVELLLALARAAAGAGFVDADDGGVGDEGGGDESEAARITLH